MAGETLYYLSKVGIMAYSGGMPRCISRVLGDDVRLSDAVGGSDGLNYYVSLKEDGKLRCTATAAKTGRGIRKIRSPWCKWPIRAVSWP